MTEQSDSPQSATVIHFDIRSPWRTTVIAIVMRKFPMATEYDKLLEAINDGAISEAKRLIETGLDLNNPCDEGATPLYAAILNGHNTLVRLMLDRGANPNFVAEEPAASMYTEKPLDLAMQARFLMDWDKFHPIVQTLIEYGATDFDGGIESPDDLEVCRQRAIEWQRNKSA